VPTTVLSTLAAAIGCKVSVKTANTSAEMVALMNEGGFGLVTASDDASLMHSQSVGAAARYWLRRMLAGVRPMWRLKARPKAASER
jgi:hypothetical protein